MLQTFNEYFKIIEGLNFEQILQTISTKFKGYNQRDADTLQFIFNELKKEDGITTPINVSWCYRMYLDGYDIDKQSMAEIRNALNLLAKLKNNKNIDGQNSKIVDNKNNFIYKNVDELEEFLSNYVVKKGKEDVLIENIDYIESGDVKVLLDDDDFLVVDCLTQVANDFYGQFTTWCTISSNLKMFYKYKKTGNVYIVIDKKLLNTKSDERFIQIHFESAQCMNLKDISCWFIFNDNKYDKIKDKLKVEYEIKEYRSFVFGGYNSNGKNDIRIKKILKGLPMFKELESLDLNSNKLKELPNEISELKNLTTLILYNNKLKKIPDDIVYLKKLSLLNLVDNPIESLPNSLKNTKCKIHLDGNDDLISIYGDWNNIVFE